MPTPLLQTPIPQSSKTGLLKRPRRRRVGTQLETSSEQARVGYAGGGGRDWFFPCSSRKWRRRRRRRKRGGDGEERHGTGIQYSSRPYKGSSTREIHPLSPPPNLLPLCVSLFPSLSRACTQACFLYKFCTKSLHDNYSPSSPSAAVQTRHRRGHERTSSSGSSNNSSRIAPPEAGATTDLTVTVTITVAVTVTVTVLVGDGNSNSYETITEAGSTTRS